MDKAADFEFNYSLYANEDEGAEDLCEHHQDKLEKLGVKFGRGGLKIVDTHKKKLGLTLKTKTGKIYRYPEGRHMSHAVMGNNADIASVDTLNCL